MRTPRCPAAVLAGLLILVSCDSAHTVEPFTPLGNVTRVEVKQANRPIATVTDRAQIRELVSFIDARPDSWETPWYGIPVPRIVAVMYDDKELKGSFGAGPDFFECQRKGIFMSRSADKKSVQAFLKILGVPTDAVGK